MAARLRERGVADVRPRSFRGAKTYAWRHAAHALVALRGGWTSLAALVSLELDASGRHTWLPRRGSGTTVVAAAGAAAREARCTIALVAHLDTARTGLVWDPRVAAPGGGAARRRLRTRTVPPYLAPVAAGMLLAALPARARTARRLGRAILGLAIAAELDVARSPHVPGASDNATGVAAAMALLADPPPGVRLIGVFCGGEESGMDGMRDWLRAEGRALAPDLVLGLDTLGAGRPIVLRAEATLLPHAYAPRDLALVPPDVERWRIGGWTDAILARFAGLPALSLLSIGPEGAFTHYHRPSDTPEHVDFASVQASVEVARAIIAAACSRARPREAQ